MLKLQIPNDHMVIVMNAMGITMQSELHEAEESHRQRAQSAAMNAALAAQQQEEGDIVTMSVTAICYF